MRHVATLTLRQPLRQLSPAERERFADMLTGYASDVVKGAVMGEPIVVFSIEEDTQPNAV